MKTTKHIDKEVVAIFGATNSIGEAICDSLSKDQYILSLTYNKNKNRAEKLKEKLINSGYEIDIEHVNCEHHETIKQYLTSLFKHYMRIDHLIYASSVVDDSRLTEEGVYDSINNIIQINLISAIYSSILFSEITKSSNATSNKTITYISSESGRFGGNGIPVYAASKGGLNSFVLGYAREQGKRGIRVNAVSPGIIRSGRNSEVKPEAEEHICKSIPLGRIGEAMDVGETVAWLISTSAKYISGTVIPVNGGR